MAACAHVGVGGSGRRAERDGGGNDGRGAEHGRGTGRYEGGNGRGGSGNACGRTEGKCRDVGNIPPGRREPRSASDAGTTLPASESECPAGRGAERHEGENGRGGSGNACGRTEGKCRDVGNIPPGRREPRSASDAGTTLPASESECRPGRPTERHGEERREPRSASDAGTPLPASESECPAGRGAERHGEGEGNGVWRGLALCAGAGGLELGLSLALPGYRAVCWVERDAYAASSLVARMEEAALDDAPVWSDLAAFDGRPWRGAVDIVTAGWPCQPFSVSGKRRGSADERHLWPHVRRVLVETGAPLLFAENVPGHVSLGLDVVRADLQDLGYDVEAGLFSAAETGAPHERRRLFLLAHAHRQPIRKLARHILEGRQADLCGREASGGHRGGGQSLDGPVSDGHGPGAGGFPPGPDAFDAWERLLAAQPGLQPALSRTSDGLADRLDRYRLVGNGVCPLAAAYALAVLAFAGLPDCFAS